MFSRGDNEIDKENSHPVTVHITEPPDYDNTPGGSDSDEDEIKYRDDCDPSKLIQCLLLVDAEQFSCCGCWFKNDTCS